MIDDREIKPGVGLRDLLAQAAAMAVKQERNGQYIGAWVVADVVMAESPEVLEQRYFILGFADLVQTLRESLYPAQRYASSMITAKTINGVKVTVSATGAASVDIKDVLNSLKSRG